MTDAERNELLIQLETAQTSYAPYLQNMQIIEAYEHEENELNNKVEELEKKKVELTDLLKKNDWEFFFPYLTDNERDNIKIAEAKIEKMEEEQNGHQLTSMEVTKSSSALNEQIEKIDAEIAKVNKKINEVSGKIFGEKDADKVENYRKTLEDSQKKLSELKEEKNKLEKERNNISADLNKCLSKAYQFVSDVSRRKQEMLETKEKQVKRAKNDIDKEMKKIESDLKEIEESLDSLKAKDGAKYKAAKVAVKEDKEFYEKKKKQIVKYYKKLGIEVDEKTLNGLQSSLKSTTEDWEIPAFMNKKDKSSVTTQTEEPKDIEPINLTEPQKENQEIEPINLAPEVKVEPEKRLFSGFEPSKYRKINVFAEALKKIKGTVKFHKKELTSFFSELSENYKKAVEEVKPVDMETKVKQDIATAVERVKEIEKNNLSTQEKQVEQVSEENEIAPINISEEKPELEEEKAPEVSKVSESPEVPEKKDSELDMKTLNTMATSVDVIQRSNEQMVRILNAANADNVKTAKMKTELVEKLKGANEFMKDAQQKISQLQNIEPEVSEQVEETKGRSL